MNGSIVGTLLAHMEHGRYYLPLSVSSADVSPGLDLSIEGMRSQQFSIGVFIFMLIGVLVFAGIIYVVAFGNAAPKTMKKGERVLFGAIVLGTLFAVAMGAMQMLSGYLF